MKILYISDHGPYLNTFIRQDVELIAKNHDVLYIAFESNKSYDSQKVKTKLIKYPSQSFKSRLKWKAEEQGWYFNWYDKKFSSKIKAEVVRFNPDIIHCQFLYESAKLLQNINTNLPVIVNIRGYGASSKLRNKFYLKWLNKISSNNNIYPIYVCENLKVNLLKKGIKFLNDGMILNTGIDTNIFNKTNYSTGKQIIFTQVAAFNDKKGQEFTIIAFNEYLKKSKSRNSKLVFIGDGKNLVKCKELVKSLKIKKFVDFKGRLSKDEIIIELDKSTVFVHHSITSSKNDQEGIPNSILEAMSMELPILSTYHSGIPEAVDHKVNGLLCVEKDTNHYSDQMKEITEWGFIQQNRIKIIQKFNIESHIKNLEKFYEEIICY